MQSQLTLKKYKLSVSLGWTETERQNKQDVYLDMTIKFMGLPKASWSDELSDTICYSRLTKMINAFCADKTFKLIEYFAHELYLFLRDQIFTDAELMLSLTKPQPCSNLGASVFTVGDFSGNNA